MDSLIEELKILRSQLVKQDKRLAEYVKQSEVMKSLKSVPGIGPITALCLVAAYGDGQHFKNGRHMAAATGLVPRQFSTGGVTRLGKITKRGNQYLRTLLVHGGRALLRSVLLRKSQDKHSRWVLKLYETKGYNKTAVAIANKNARIAYRILRNPELRFCGESAHQEITAH